MFCPWCGKPNQEGANYCISCGRELKNSIQLQTNEPTKSSVDFKNPLLLFITCTFGAFLETFGLIRIYLIGGFSALSGMSNETAIKLTLLGFWYYFVLIAIGFVLIMMIRPRIENKIPPSQSILVVVILLSAAIIGIGLGFMFAFP